MVMTNRNIHESKICAPPKPNVRGHLQVRALFRALEHGVQRLDAVVEYAVATGNRSRRLQFKLL
jgi:hypothetical protein